MNKNLYRLVFNARRGQMMAVAEAAGAQGKSASTETHENSSQNRAQAPIYTAQHAINLIAAAILSLPFLTPLQAHAQITADASAPANQQPQIVPTANGLPQVNIQTPSAGGVSRNVYSQFDVNAAGAILNNARTPVQTQLGGWVQGNGNLAAGSARVILNEVNATQPSQLKGFVEVAGQRAEVIIANPSGIQVDGGGFINASGVTLTTGTAQINPANGGSLDSYRVQQGLVTIDGAGLDASGADFTRILARATQTNAGIWAKDLRVVTGANDINASTHAATAIAGTGAAPAFAIDVAELGGMYAGKITLVGTEAGLGVRNAGVIGASAGDVILQNNGWLSNSSNIQATGNVGITTQGNISNTRLIAAQGGTTLQASGAGAQISSAAGSAIAAGLNADGTVKTTGELNITATGLVSLNGKTAAGGNASISAAQINTASGNLTAQNISLTASGAIDNTQGTIASTAAGSGIIVMTAVSLNNTQGNIAGKDITVTLADSLNNSAGTFSADNAIQLQDTATVKALGISNAGGNIIAGQSTSINAASLSGNGKVQSRGSVAVALTSDFNNQGDLVANTDLNVTTSGNFSNSERLEAGQTLNVVAADIKNTATLVGQNVSLKASQQVLNRGPQAFIGASSGTGLLEILATDIINRDDTTATDTSAQTTIIGLGKVVLAGSKDGAGNYSAANSVRNESARLSSTGDMAIYAATLTNTRRVLTTSGGYTPTSSVSGTGFWSPGNPDVPGGRYIEPAHGGAMNADYIYTTYNGTVSTNSISQISPKGVIESGANLTPVVSRFNNYFSAVTAAGDIPLNGVTLDQNSWVNGPSGNITPYGQSVQYTGSYFYRIYTGVVYNLAWGPTSPAATPLPGYDASFTAGGAISGTGNTLLNTTGVNPATPLGTQSGAGTGTPASPIALPSGGLFRQTSDPASKYLIETNPAFTNNGLWLSSDYYFSQLGQDPSTIQKRLGDGYYEQQRVLEQIMGLTGRAILEYPDAQTQYQALMQAGAKLARSLQLAPGIGLSAAQVAQLSSDVIIMQEIILNGQAVLTPVVYLSANSTSRLLPTGPLIAANSIDLTDSQNIVNSGTIHAVEGLNIAALNIDSRGGKLQSSGLMSLASQSDIDLTSAQLKAGNLNLDATRNIILSSDATQVSSAVAGGTRQSTQLGQTASMDVTGEANIKTGNNFIQNAGNITVGGNLSAQVGGDWQMGAVQNMDTIVAVTSGGFSNTQVVRQQTSGLSVGGSSNLQVANNFTAQGASIALAGPATLQAGRNITLTVVKDSMAVNAASSSSDHKDGTQSLNESVRGTNLQTGNNLTLISGRDITLQASTVNAAQGAATLQAASKVNVEFVAEQHQNNNQHTGTSSGFLSRTTTTERKTSEQSFNIGSALSGSTVNVIAGTDINVKGSSVISDTATTLVATNNVNIEAATDTSRQSTFYKKEESGLMSSGGIGVSFGNREQSTDQKGLNTTAAASTVGSIAGNVNIVGGQTYTQTGSDVLTPAGDITIQAKDIRITEARETGASQSEQKFRQSGITLAITAPVITALQSAVATAQATTQTKDSRMQALGAAATALSAKSAVDGIQGARAAMDSGKGAAEAAGIGISISIGSSSSNSQTSQQNNTAQGSTLQAGGNITLAASGAGQDSNILIQGSAVKAGDTVNLSADNQVQLLASQNTASQTSTNDSNSASLGIGFTVGGASNGFTINASASGGRGNADGRDLNYTNSHIEAGQQVKLTSGGDTTLQGAVITANTVQANVGGNLVVESLQDKSEFDSKQSNFGVGVSLCIPPFCVGASSANVSAGKSKADSNFASVTEQSGIRAGDGGFQVSVAGHTDLKGGAITSTQVAIDQNRNSFNANTEEGISRLTTSDIQNRGEFSASSMSASVSTGGGSAGIGQQSGQASSTTQAAISGLAGNQAARTGDKESGITKLFDASEVTREINAQTLITSEFGKQASKAAGDYAASQLKEAIAKQDQEGIDQWKEGGSYRTALHTALGALSGGVGGAAGAALVASNADTLNQLQDRFKNTLIDAGLSEKTAAGLANMAFQSGALAAGALVGGSAGAATALNVDANNRQLHPDERKWAKDNAAKYKTYLEGKTGESVTTEEAYQRLLSAGYAVVDDGAAKTGQSDETAKRFINETSGSLFVARAQERANPLLGGNADGSYTPEQQARFGIKNPSELAQSRVQAAQPYLNKDCATYACSASKVQSIAGALSALEQEKTLYQNDPIRTEKINTQQNELLGNLSAKDILGAKMQAADEAFMMDLLMLPALPSLTVGVARSATLGRLVTRVDGVGAESLAARGGANGGVVGRGIAYEAPSTLVQSRVDDLLTQIPANSQGRITMGVAVVEDANGVRSVVVSTSEPRSYLRPGVTLQPGEKVIAGTGHAEADIVSYANANGLKIIDIGATRPVCSGCQNTLAPTGANITTPLKPTPTPGKP